MEGLPDGWECNLTTCLHYDSLGNDHSCSASRLEECPIASMFITDEILEELAVGQIALHDGVEAVRAYFCGRALGQSLAQKEMS